MSNASTWPPDLIHCILQARTAGLSDMELCRKYRIGLDRLKGFESYYPTMPILDTVRLEAVEKSLNDLVSKQKENYK